MNRWAMIFRPDGLSPRHIESHSNPHVREHGGDSVDHSNQLWMGLFQFIHGRFQTENGMPEQFGILFSAGGFVGGKFGETGDALGLLLMSLGEHTDLRFQLSQQIQQLGAGLVLERAGAADAVFDF